MTPVIAGARGVAQDQSLGTRHHRGDRPVGLKLWFADGAVIEIAGCLRSITVPRTTRVQEFLDSRKS